MSLIKIHAYEWVGYLWRYEIWYRFKWGPPCTSSTILVSVPCFNYLTDDIKDAVKGEQQLFPKPCFPCCFPSALKTFPSMTFSLPLTWIMHRAMKDQQAAVNNEWMKAAVHDGAEGFLVHRKCTSAARVVYYYYFFGSHGKSPWSLASSWPPPLKGMQCWLRFWRKFWSSTLGVNKWGRLWEVVCTNWTSAVRLAYHTTTLKTQLFIFNPLFDTS